LFLAVFWGTAAVCFAQSAVILDTSLQEAAAYINETVPPGSKTAVLNVESPTAALSSYVLEELSAKLVNTRNLTMVDRQNLDKIRQEEAYQLSGEVSDETAQRIGAKLGAQVIITGSFTQIGKQSRIRIRAIAVESAQIYGIFTADIKVVARLRDLLSPEPGPKIPPRADAWKHKRLYLGGRGGVSLGFYKNAGGLLDKTVYLSQSITGMPSYNAALYGAVSLLDLLELQLEAAVTGDFFELYSGNTLQMEVSWTSLMIPLLAKFAWRPSIFVLQGYAGPGLNIPLSQLDVKHRNGSYTADISPTGGIVAGGSFGVKVGPGAIMGDIRYAGDFSSITAQYNGAKDIAQRNKLSFFLGYEIGIIDKH
jgi:TolB-like protein